MKSTASESRQQDSLRYLGKLQFSDYPRLMAGLRDLPEGHRRPLLRAMCRIDLYFLLRYVMNRQDLQDPWLFARCREVQEEPDGRLDLWARGHYKSTIITFAKTIQDILASHGEDPIPDWGGMQPTFAIFSHTRPTAKAFLRQIKQELEFNRVLMELFPDILYAKPQSQAPKWSEDDGIVVRRLSNPKESTVEAWGLVDGQPTGRHFNVMTYDDVVVKESVTTPDMIKKTTDAMRLSFNLGDREPRKRFIGTRYHFADTYHTVMKERIAKPRIHPATDNGELDGTPVFLTPPQLEAKVREMGPYIACFPASTPILMADGSERPIASIHPGERVIGFKTGSGSGKGRLVPATVKAIGRTVKPLVKATFESREELFCTPDHKFYTGRSAPHRTYAELGFNYHGLKHVERVYCPSRIRETDREAAAYLRGIIDGEGSITRQVNISQSPGHNPEVCQRIEACLHTLGIEYAVHDRPAGVYHGRRAKAGRQYRLKLKRSDVIWLLNAVRPAKPKALVDGLTTALKSTTDRLIELVDCGNDTVYNIETETGNYVAWGVMVKNSAQLMQNPIADSRQVIKREWIRHFKNPKPEDWRGANIALLIDPANEKKKSNDFTAMAVVCRHRDRNLYLLDAVRDRLTLGERIKLAVELHQKWLPGWVGWEKYGKDADIDALRDYQDRINYHFHVTDVGGPLGKIDRINRLLPMFADARIWLPIALWRTIHTGETVDVVATLIEEEILPWPVPVHEDLLDAISRIEDLSVPWPGPAEPERKRDRYSDRGEKGSWMSR